MYQVSGFGVRWCFSYLGGVIGNDCCREGYIFLMTADGRGHERSSSSLLGLSYDRRDRPTPPHHVESSFIFDLICNGWLIDRIQYRKFQAD